MNGLISQSPPSSRRGFLRQCGFLAAALVTGPLGWGASDALAPPTLAELMPALGPPDENGLRMLPGGRSRIVAHSGHEPPGTSGTRWHAAPDGGAVFPAPGGGWIYVSNSELPEGRGGVGALRFNARGEPVAAYRLLSGTHRNCAGGATPWGTWLSCEEVPRGLVWECDPAGKREAIVRPALGRFSHEAAAVDPRTGHVYLTEDRPDGRLYRFVPEPDKGLAEGRLHAARVNPAGGGTEGSAPGGTVSWHPVPDPEALQRPTRHQVPGSTPFNRGEGIGWHDGRIVFATTGDHRLWMYEPDSGALSVLYDAAAHHPPVLTWPDNLTFSPGGTVLVAEDGGDMQIVALLPDGRIFPIVQVTGQPGSELTGPAFDPSGTRLYFSSQRGTTGKSADGITYEVSGLRLE